jgi:4-amino-4-deoxy-L-arabinose transferase-like glycosyltransferase
MFALCATFGLGSVGTFLLWLSMLGITPSRREILLLGLCAFFAIVLLDRVGRRPRIVCPTLGIDDWPGILPLATVAYCVLVVTVAAVAFGAYETDAFAIWGLKAKVLATAPLLPRPQYFTDRTLSYSHLDYPLLVPALQAGVYAMLGRFDDRWVKIIFPLMYVATGAIVYAALRRWLNRCIALLLVALLMGAPGVVRWAGPGVADVAVAMFGACAAWQAYEWIDRRDRRALAAAVACCAFLAMSKPEGVVMAALVAVSLLARSPRSSVIAIACGVIAILPWVIWSRGLPQTFEAYDTRFALANIRLSLPRLATIARGIVEQVVNLQGWSILWILLLAAAAAGHRAFRRRATLAVWFVLLLQLLAYAAAYLVTPWDLEIGIPMTIYRLLLQVAPLAVMLIGIHASSLLPPPRDA